MHASTLNRNLVARHPLLSFFTLAILITWTLALPSLLFGLPFKPFQTAGAFGPLLAAVIVSALMGGGELKALLGRMTSLRFGAGWLLLAVFGNVILYLLMAGFSGAPLIQSLAEKWVLVFTLYLPALFTAFLVNPIGEETGWTGFGAAHLQRRFRPWVAAVILGAVWGVWHLPGFFVRSELGAFSPAIFIFTMLSCILSRLLWTWVTNHSRGSGIIGVLLHASSNAASLALIPAVLPAPTPQQMAASGMLLLGIQSLAALLIMLLTGGRLSFRPQRMETGTLPEKMLAESQMG